MIHRRDILLLSCRQVARTRPWGVILSIAFGIAAFLLLGVLGQEIRKKLGDDFLLMGGVNVLQIVMEDDRYPGTPWHYFSEASLTKVRELDNVQYAGANVQWSPMYHQAIGLRNIPIRIVGIDQYFIPIHELEVEAGRGLTEEDVRLQRRVCLLGHQAAVEIYGSPERALGQHIYASRNDTAEVVGVINGVMLASWTGHAFMPYTAVITRQLGDSPLMNRIFVRVRTWEAIPSLVDGILRVIPKVQAAPHLAVHYQKEQFKRIDATFFWLNALLWMSIGLALLLGGFGIWSGTFSAVRARTHEIGLKKAIGATNRDIRELFLVEALVKALAGGGVGLALGGIGVAVGIYALDCSTPWSLLAGCGLGGVLFSALLGVGAGMYPAARASRMDVVDSLRFE